LSTKALLEEGLALARELDSGESSAFVLNRLALVAERQGDHALARALYEEGLALARELRERLVISTFLEGLARLAGAHGQPRYGAQLFGAANGLGEPGMPRALSEQAEYEQAIVALRAALGEEAFAAAWAEGRALPLDEAIALALEGHTEASGGR
jgi:hypothetical protein